MIIILENHDSCSSVAKFYIDNHEVRWDKELQDSECIGHLESDRINLKYKNNSFDIKNKKVSWREDLNQIHIVPARKIFDSNTQSAPSQQVFDSNTQSAPSQQDFDSNTQSAQSQQIFDSLNQSAPSQQLFDIDNMVIEKPEENCSKHSLIYSKSMEMFISKRADSILCGRFIHIFTYSTHFPPFF